MGFWTGTSRVSSREAPSRAVDRRRRRPISQEKSEDAGPVELRQPDLAELRSRRTEYYSAPPSQQRRISRTRTVKSSSKRPSSVRSSQHNSDTSQRPKPRRVNNPTTVPSDRSENAEYVYPSRESTHNDGTSPSVKRVGDRRRNSARTKASVLPMVTEVEITPDDSISQVGRNEVDVQVGPARPMIRSRRTEPSIRSSTTPRTSTKHPTASSWSLRRHSTTTVRTQPRLIECLTCGSDDIPVANSAKLPCSHRMCHDCLRRVFEMSIKDPQHMPPKQCCSDDYIPLKYVDGLFDVSFKKKWNRKFEENVTKDRIYCPALKCGEWIKPSHIHTLQGRKYALCPRCKTKVCVQCMAKLHKSSECPKDPEIAKLVAQAKKEGWQRCYKCKALIERREGCNHMTCRCQAEFCILCAAPWKTCDCPWFNYSQLPVPDQLNEMRVPQPVRTIYRQIFGDAANDAAPPANLVAHELPWARPARSRLTPETIYAQERENRQRQERLDADLARRLQLASIMEPDDGGAAAERPYAQLWGVGNAAENFMNDDFVQNAANVVMGTFGDANFGRRGERQSGRRRRARQTEQVDADAGLAPNFLGDASLLDSR